MATSKKQKKKLRPGHRQTDTQERLSSSRTPAATPMDSENQTAIASPGLMHSPKWTVYTSIEQLTLDRFIDCVCDNNMQRLVIDGDPSPADLAEAWIVIKSQHLENMNDAKSNFHIVNGVEFHRFQLKRLAVEALLYLLEKNGYDEELIDLLRDEEYDYPFTEETYQEDIIKVRGELGSESLDVESYLQQTGEESQTPTKEVFYKSLMALQKHLGLCTGMPPRKAAAELTVYEFGMACKEYNKLAKATNPQENVNA
ncbi:hypothetical protein JST56_07260 [Candidatus Dependentiae bacterium]|nr:hypothetical protein [Candidatus Dependentiae bacterium]